MMKDGINANTILFFLRFLKEFDRATTVSATTKKLSKAYNVNLRTLQRYLLTLAEKCYIVDRRILEKSRHGDHMKVARHEFELTEKTFHMLSEFHNSQLKRANVIQIE
jgi:CTP-dependent riboflavin kinase